MSKNKLIIICFILFMVSISITYAQLEEQIDSLLGEENAGFDKTTYVVLVASGECEETASLADALDTLKSKNWGITLKGSDDSISLGEYSYLLMKAFNIPGGIMYMLLPGPRYAVRELAYLKLLIENPDPARLMTGEEVMTILTRVLDWKEAE
ncbi:MAG: hypothetical protein JXJ04_24695 [Spirochaetales bacterium]|nr:hypothetical protein [Spirochaetales bacterium]